jgi:hypothetical protein
VGRLLKSKNAFRVVLLVSALAIAWVCFALGTHRHTRVLRTLAEVRQFLGNTSGSADRKPRGSTSPGRQHSVNLSWKASASAVLGYNVYRRDRWGLSKVNSAPVTSTSYLDNSVQPGEIYYYVTRAVSSTGIESSPSNEIRVVVPSP